MDITRRCDYACRMLRAVCQGAGKRISVADIAEVEDIPYSFARSIQHDLVKAGLLCTTRGARGGVALSRGLSDISVLDVLRAVEGSVAISPCSEDPAYCLRSGSCAYHRVWCGADRLLEDYFESITLADLFATPAEEGCDACSVSLADGEAPHAKDAIGEGLAAVASAGAEATNASAEADVFANVAVGADADAASGWKASHAKDAARG